MPAVAYRKPVEGSNLVAYTCRDGARLGSIARAFDADMDTRAPPSRAGQPPPGIHASHRDRFIVFPGGVPLGQSAP